ncbi:Abhydrolase domain-containing protein 16A [Schistosoma japonicum]|nr:Abhydrolase domain-containing protein 16A [Schistosoma japonicum]
MTTENEFTLNTYLSLNSEEQKDALSKLTHNPNKYEKLVVNFLKSEALKKQINSNSNSTTCLYPSELGKEISKSDVKTHILFYLVSQYFIESPGSHCVPLEGRYLRPPWSPLTQSLSESSSSDLDAKIDD